MPDKSGKQFPNSADRTCASAQKAILVNDSYKQSWPEFTEPSTQQDCP